MTVAAPWCAVLLGTAQSLRYMALLALSYWSAIESIGGSKVEAIVRRDWARPWFEPYGFCGAWTSYDPYLTAAMGLDAPGYAAGSLVHGMVTLVPSCIDAMTTARGQVIMVPFVFLLWYCTGRSLGRLAQRRWKPRVQGDIRLGVTYIVLFSATALGALLLMMSALAAFASDAGQIVRGLGLAFWMFFVAVLASERLRVWPFRRLVDPPKPVSRFV